MRLNELLERNGVPVSSRGHKHFKDGWTHLCCPFCGDDGFHLGFADGYSTGRCFKCGKRRLAETLELVLRLPKSKAIGMSKEISGKPHPRRREETETEAKPKEVQAFPFGSLPFEKFHKNHINYLENRDFDPLQLAEDWDVKVIGAIGERPWTVIIPVYNENGVMVSWQARDITGSSSTRYYTHQASEIKQTLYGLNLCHPLQKKIIVVEGVTDAWRFTPGFAVATFGQDWSSSQFRLLLRFDFILILFDSETVSQNVGRKLADQLSAAGKVSEARSVMDIFGDELGESYVKDPGDLDQKLAYRLEDDFFGNLEPSKEEG